MCGVSSAACRGRMFAAHICCVVAQLQLGSYNDCSFDLIGCNSLPFEKPAIREAIERSEVYEYVLFMTSGFAQPSFQEYKLLHARMLAREGLTDQALEYSECIARAVITSPSSITTALMKQIVQLSEKLHRGRTEEPEWLLKLRRLLQQDEMSSPPVLISRFPSFKWPESPVLRPFPVQLNTTPEEVAFASRYILGELLGKGGMGSVYAGVRKADGKSVSHVHIY
ncbi:protein transport protein Sec16B-like isoform X1 [Clarias gariepinus]|uniref:protein transport protein Sec16B-like isoform X1 n=1 Tax=Clarias gariepinus TaxID=13013 RepID=UPI00234DE3F1|nr:protein transport protein Sec16B-like isoform X1 [Clarias gariepinus]